MISSLIVLLAFNVPEYPIQFHQKTQKQERKTETKWDTLPNDYLDQVIHRKKNLIRNCSKKLNLSPYDFTVELTISPSGKTQSRLIESSEGLQFQNVAPKKSSLLTQHQMAHQCILSTLNRIRFKSFSSHASIVKKYSFEFEQTE